MRLRLPFIDLFSKSGLLFALLLAITLHGNAQGLFSPVADAVNTGGNCYRLTTADVSRRGAVWYNNKIDLLSDFDIQFTLNFGDRSGFSGGDGMAFVLQPTSTTEIGVAGSAKGYGNDYVPGTYQITTPGISPSMAIEYDTYDDEGGTTGLGTLVLNGDYRHLPGFDGAGTVGLGFLTDGLDHSSRVTWNAATQTITFYVDGIQRFTYQRDLINVVFGGQHLVYFGFTAGTGGSVNQQSVCFDATNSTFASPVTPTLGQIFDACAGGSSGSATINLQGGTNPFIVALNGVSHVFTQSNITTNSVTFSNLPADVYSVRILESNGFENNDLSFTINDNPTPSITASGPLTFCQGGSVVLTASAGSAYVWSTGETTPSITVTNSGTYNVSITNGNCTSTSPSFEVIVNPSPATPILSLSGPTEFCEGGSLVLSVTNVEGVAYQWLKSVDGGFADPIPGETGTSLTVTTAGRYTVMATSLFCGMIVSGTYEIFVNPKPIISAVTGNATICAGSTSTLTASSPSFGSTFQWSEVIIGGGVFGSNARVVVGAGAEFTTPALLANATYEVVATDLNGCESDPQTFNITVEPALTTPTISASRSLVLCSYNSVVLTSSAATGNTWSNGETTQSITVTPASVGSYTVTVNNGVCSATSEASVVTNAPAFVSSITASGPTLICDGSSVTYTLNEPVPSVSRSWYRYFEGQYDPTFNETGLSIVVTKSGNYGVNIIDSYGCFSNPPGSHDVTVLPPPTKPLDFTISSTNACTINSGTVAAIIDFSSGVAPINMNWNDGNGFITNAQTINNIPPGTYTATVYDYCGTTVVKAVTITGAVTASAITATATTVCTGSTTTLRVSDINPSHTYQWYKDGSIIAGATGTTYEGSAGNYQISASDGSCSAFSTSLFISERVVTAPLDFTVTSSNSCSGPNTGMIDQGPFTGGGFSYVNLGWTGPNGFFRDDVSMLSNLAAGTYTLGVRDFCGTVLTKSVTILQGTSFDKNLVIDGPQILCSNGAAIRITAAAGATSYSWNKTVNGTLTNNFVNTPFIDVTEAGFYSVVMTDAIGCETYSFAYSIAAPNPSLAITAQSSNSCNATNNGTANITSLVGGNIPYTISWSGPNGYTSSQYSINNLAAGVYTVTAQDACGTTVSANVTVLEPAPQPQTMAVSGSTTLCNPESSVTISAYAGAVTYVWQRIVNGVTIPVAGSTNSINATEPGAYYVSMTDANGCFQNSDFVNVYAANSIPLTVDLTSYTNGVSCFNGGGVVNASYSGGTAPITFVGWTGPNGYTSTANNIASLAPGTYIATYRDFCGVEATGSITFTAGEEFILPTVTPSAPFCGSNAVTLTMGATPYSFEWYQYDMINEVFVRTFSPNQNTIVLSADAGYYYYPVLKDANNCYGYPTGFSTAAPTPITFSVSSSPSCGPNNGTANIFNITGGSYPVTYSWTDGASFNSTDGFITNLAPGTYTVTAMDACANAVSQSVTITGGIAAATITSTSQNICAGSSAVLSVTNYNAAYSYQWRKEGVIIPGATGETYAANLQGNYLVEVSDGVCNSYSGSIFVNVALPPSLTVFSSPSCGSPNTGSAYVQSVSGGKLPFTYSWTDGGTFSSTAQTVSNLAAGNYAVTVTDACGLQDTKLFTINQLPAVSGTISGVTAICTEGGSTILTASTNGTPATFAWSKIIGGVATYDISSTNTISASETGTYMVNIKDVNGCFSLPSIYVTAAGTPLTLTLTGTQSCGPSTGSVGAIFSGAAPITVSWTDGGSFSTTANFVNNIPGGTYTATATDACGVSVSKVITISGQVPAATITATATNVCVGSSAILSITNVDPTVTYQWRLNGIDIAGATATTYTAAASGTYTVFASKSGCTTNSAGIVITVWALPAVFNVSVNAPVCPGANSPAFTLSGSQTGTVYSTYLNGVLVKYINNPTVAYTINGTGAPISFSAATIQTSGNYTVVATTNLGGCTSTMNGSANVVVNPRPPVPTITASGSLTICEGETVTLTPETTSIIPSASFTWTKYDYVAANNSYATTESITVTDGASYRVVIKDANGCIAASLFTDVFVTIPKPPTVTANGATTICPDGSVNLTATANANQSKNALKFDGSNYAEAPHQSYMGLTKRLSIEAWFKTDDAGATQYIVSKGTNDFTPGQYGLLLTGGKVQFHLSNNTQHYGVVGTTDIQAGKWYHAAGTWDSTTVTLYINGVSEGQNVFIGPMTANTEPLEIGRLGKPLSEYYFQGEIDEVRIWNNALTAEQINAQKGRIINVSNNMVANYRFEEGTGTTLADNGFGNPATLFGSNIWVTSTAPFYNYTPTYLWSPGEATTSTINVNTAGSYTVTVNEGGCTNTSDPIIITSIPVATITASGSLTLLPGQSVTLTASAGTSYVWSNGATTPSIVVSTAEIGTYTVTVTNNGCTTTSAATIVSADAGIAPVINVPADMAVNNDPGTCGAIVNFTATETTGSPASTITYSHAPGSFFPIGSTTVTATATNAAGVSTSNFIVTVVDNQAPVVTTQNITVQLANGTATITPAQINNGSADNCGIATYSLDKTSFDCSNTGSNTVTLTVTDINGNTQSATAIVEVTGNTTPVTITAGGPTTFCSGGSVTLTSSSVSGNVWSTGETSPSITVTQSGNYSVTATDASGCSAISANTNVTVNTAPVVTPIVTASGSTALCEGGNLGLSVAAMGGSSLRFNGSNYLEAPSAPGNSLSTAFTAELWFKTDNAAATQYLVSKGKSDGAPGQYGLVLVNGRVQLHLGGAGSASINSVTLLQSNVWYHVAGTWDGATGIARLYLNGSYEGQVTTGINSNLGTNVEPLQIGRLGLSCCPYMFRGEMDEIRIWNVARDAGQIANGRSLSFSNTPNLVANYHFDEGSGTVTYDSAPGGSNATLVNSPAWQVSAAPVNAPNSSYLWSNGETTPNISVNTAGSYTATVTFVTTDGCTATGTAAPVSVTNVPAATVTASGPLTFCPGGSVILTASAGSAYSWSNGATTQSITVTQSGNYTVSVTNGLGCTTVSAPVAVSVADITAPVPDLPSLPVISMAPNGLIAAPTATDDCSGVSVIGTTTDQVTNLLSGTYTITWMYADASGNTSSQTQTVIVADMAPPSLKAMNRIVKNNDPGVCGAMVTYVMPVANDNASTTKVTINEGGGDGVITFNTPLSQNVTSLDFISAGEYQDIVHGHGVDIAIQVELYNPQSAVWTLVQTVQTGTTDYHFGGTSVQFPAISQVSQIRFTASQPVYAAFHFYEMSVNLNSIAAVQTAGLPSGSVFPIGITLNTFRAVDFSGNEAFTSFEVEVLDAEKPRMANYTSTTYPAGTSGTWTGSAATIAISDNCGSETLQLTEEYFDQRGNRFYQGQSPVAQGNLVLASRTFPVGTNTVVVSISDVSGNISDRARFNVTITDVTAPAIVVSGNMTQTADPGVCAAWVKVPIPVTSDNCSVQSVANSFNGSPSAAGRYPVGTTVITWTVTDGSGNKTTATQTITVVDNEPPVLVNVPLSVIQTNDAGSCGAVVTWDGVRATDNCGLISFVSNHQSGEIFPLGETVVTFTATDRNGNVGTSSFTITIKDNEAPKVITRPVTVTLVNGSATILPSAINNGSSDNCGAVTLSASKTVFTCADAGVNKVTLSVTDANGNVSSAIALVTVIGEVPTSVIKVIPSSSIYTGGVPTDIYLGYGPQSVTLSTTVTGAVPVSYNWTGSTGLSCITCANPVFTPTAAGSYSFTVVVTNSYGCTTTASVTICVRDIRVPSSNGRVYVCHTDLNTGTTTTLSMATNTVANQLLQNPQDKLGSCGMAPCSQVVVTAAPELPKTMTPEIVEKISKETAGIAVTGLSVKASPNPTRDVFTFIVTSAGKLPVHIRLLNEAGQMQESRNNIQLGSAFTMGRSLHAGVYLAEVIQGKERVVVKLIKMIK